MFLRGLTSICAAHCAIENPRWSAKLSGEEDRRCSEERRMAPRKSLQRRPASATGEAIAGITMSALAGRFAYKFSGYAVLQMRSWWLMGLGTLEIGQDGKVKGAQRSTIMPTEGQGIDLIKGAWDLQGTIRVQSDATGHASIRFSRTTAKGETRLLDGEFFVLVPEVNRFWMISTEVIIINPGVPIRKAHESVEVEAIRIG
jgi:hypothetical protein